MPSRNLTLRQIRDASGESRPCPEFAIAATRPSGAGFAAVRHPGYSPRAEPPRPLPTRDRVTTPLPIDEILPAIGEPVAAGRNVVVEAPPGAGKTTRVPRHLLEIDAARGREILVLQPRRIAARAAARFVAASLGEPVGERCGYRVRFESRTSEATKLCFLTEALLLRRLRDDAALADVGVVVFDELHERHLATDTGLALVRRLQRERDDAPRIVAMSATLDAEPVARFLDAERLRSEGRAFPVDVVWAEPASRTRGGRPPRLEDEVRAALRRLLEDDPGGHVLVFLPGAAEIRYCEQACGELAARAGLEIHPLHGALPASAQDRALDETGARKLVLATNVAETSLTIDGVRAVIDSGLARVARDDPWTGLPTLELARISQASAAQRAGRAGRTAPGRAIRLYTRHDHDDRAAFTPPEIVRLDLADLVMDALSAGASPRELDWLEPPPAASLERAESLLRDLGAIDDAGRTETGRAMAALPVHPRHARLLVEARRRGVGREAAAAVALLSEARPAKRDAQETDLIAELHDLGLLGANEAARSRRPPRTVVQLRDQLLRALGRVGGRAGATPDDADEIEQALRIAIAAGHPDHVAMIRRGEAGQCSAVLAGGGAATIEATQLGASDAWIVALEVERRREGGREVTRVRRFAAIEPEWLLELFADRIEEREEVRFDERRERVEARSELRYGALVLAGGDVDAPPERAAAVLREAALATDLGRFVAEPEELDRLFARTAFAAEHGADGPALDADAAREVLSDLCADARSFAQLRDADLIAHLRARLGANAASLDDFAPTAISLPGRRRVPVHYERDKPPWIESRMQDFFGLAEGPAVAGGRVPLVLHLLAPNGRAQQVTTDLAGFWERHYPGLRKTLMRRYPRHAWPEDPRHAEAPRRGPRSGARKR